MLIAVLVFVCGIAFFGWLIFTLAVREMVDSINHHRRSNDT